MGCREENESANLIVLQRTYEFCLYKVFIDFIFL